MTSELEICGDQGVLIAYVYDESDAGERRRVEAHLASCPACARAVEDLRGVRRCLAGWTPPERALGFKIVAEPLSPPPPRAAGWTRWALPAAAVLVLAAAAAIANLELRFGPDGVTVRAGRGVVAHDAAPVSRAVGDSTAGSPRTAAAAPDWRAELGRVEERLRGRIEEVAASAVPPAPQPAASVATDAELLARVRALVEESERRQQRELALRLSQLVRDIDAQRRSDLVRIEAGLGRLEGLTGAEVAQQRELLDYLVRVSSQQR